MSRQTGAALLLALLLTAIISVVMISMMSVTRLNTELNAMLRSDLETRLKLETAKSELLMTLFSTNMHLLGNHGDLTFKFYGEPFEFGGVQVSIQDLSGLVPITFTDRDSMRKRLVALLPDHNNIDALTDELLDWMDEDNFRRLEGAEMAEFMEPAFPLNQPMQRAEELAFVPSLTDQDYERIKGLIDVSPGDSFNPIHVPEPLVDHLLTEQEAEQLREARLDNQQARSEIEGSSFPSGLFLITLSPLNNPQKQLRVSVVRALGTLQPIYVIDESYR